MRGIFGHGDTKKPDRDNYTADYLARRVASVAGEGWTRTACYWSSLEPESGIYDERAWVNLHRVLDRYHAHGLRPVCIVGGTPVWALKGRHPRMGPHEEYLPRWKALFVRLATEFPFVVWEIFNEADLVDDVGKGPLDYLGGNRPEGATEYAGLCRLAYEAVHSASKDGGVIPCFAQEKFDGAPFDSTFQERFLQAGGGKWSDYIPLHYYQAFESTWGGLLGKAREMRLLWGRYNQVRPIIATEFGARRKASKDDRARALYLLKEYIRATHSGMFEALLWFRWSYETGQTNDQDFSLAGLSGEETTESRAFGIVAGMLRDAVPVGLDSLGVGTNIEAYQFQRPNKTRFVVWWRRDVNVSGSQALIVVKAPFVYVTSATTGIKRRINDGDPSEFGSHIKGVLGLGAGVQDGVDAITFAEGY